MVDEDFFTSFSIGELRAAGSSQRGAALECGNLEMGETEVSAVAVRSARFRYKMGAKIPLISRCGDGRSRPEMEGEEVRTLAQNQPRVDESSGGA